MYVLGGHNTHVQLYVCGGHTCNRTCVVGVTVRVRWAQHTRAIVRVWWAHVIVRVWWAHVIVPVWWVQLYVCCGHTTQV